MYDPRLKDLRIGLHMVGDDYVPPGHLLAAQGLASQFEGYSLYGANGEANPSARLIDAVAKNEVDLAILWGPFAGYFASRIPSLSPSSLFHPSVSRRSRSRIRSLSQCVKAMPLFDLPSNWCSTKSAKRFERF